MKINCFSIKMTEAEALKIAREAGGFAGRLLFGKKAVHLRIMYLESRYYIYEMTYMDNFMSNFLAALFRKSPKGKAPDRQNIRVMVEATTCTAAYVAEDISVQETEMDEAAVQPGCYSDDRLCDCGRIMARRLVRRHLGRNLTIRPVHEEKVYRPFYIAIYGEMTMGTKARYLPIAADGYAVSRTF